MLARVPSAECVFQVEIDYFLWMCDSGTIETIQTDFHFEILKERESQKPSANCSVL